MKFVLEIELANDAMTTPDHISAALVKVSKQVWVSEGESIYDVNGNKVGHWEIQEIDDDY